MCAGHRDTHGSDLETDPVYHSAVRAPGDLGVGKASCRGDT